MASVMTVTAPADRTAITSARWLAIQKVIRMDDDEPSGTAAPVQWCVLTGLGQVWRGHDGSWTREYCERWIAETYAAVEIMPDGAFVLGRREVGPWEPVATGHPEGESDS